MVQLTDPRLPRASHPGRRILLTLVVIVLGSLVAAGPIKTKPLLQLKGIACASVSASSFKF